MDSVVISESIFYEQLFYKNLLTMLIGIFASRRIKKKK